MVGFSFSARAYNPLRRVREKLVACWTPKVSMDSRPATAILSYSACYASAPTRVSVGRAQRVQPRKTASSESTVISIAPAGATVQRHSRVAAHKSENAEPTRSLETLYTTLQPTQSRMTQSSISVSPTGGESPSYTPNLCSAVIPLSSTAPELGASCLGMANVIGPASKQRSYFLRGAATAPNLRLGSEPSYISSFSSSTSSSSSVAWGVNCSPSELAPVEYICDLLEDASPPYRGSYTRTIEGKPSSSLRSHVCLPSDLSSGSMIPSMSKTPLKCRQRRRSSGSSACLLFSSAPFGEIEHSFRSRSIDLDSEAHPSQPGTPIFDRPSTLMELPPTPLKGRISCSFDCFEDHYGMRYCAGLGSDLAAVNIPHPSDLPLEPTPLQTLSLNLPVYEEPRDANWETVTLPVAPKRAVPPHIRTIKRKRAMRDLRTGWGFPSHSTSLGPLASKEMSVTKVTTDPRLLTNTICE